MRDALRGVLWRALRWSSPLFTALLIGLASQTAHAQITDPPPDSARLPEDSGATTRGLALGTGSRANALGTSAVMYNAANLPLARVYHVESIFGYLAGEGAYTLGGVVADSVSNKIAAGLSTRAIFGGGARPYDGWDARMSLGMPIGDSIGIGVSGRYFSLTRADQDSSFVSRKGFTMDVSVRVTPTDGLNFAALAYNLINRNTSLAPTLLGGSAAYSFSDRLSLGADLLADITTFDTVEYLVGGGVELLIGDSLPIRVGYRHDTGRGTGRVTGSIGYVDRSFGVDLAFQQTVTGKEPGTQLLVSIRYQVQ
ncbi:MAG: hypothetical protein GXP55_05280 [Deltaproteobacteria bacterium]|nr:hypothetical protein [Deltaproteobacteria bacterium]